MSHGVSLEVFYCVVKTVLQCCSIEHVEMKIHVRTDTHYKQKNKKDITGV